MRLLCLLAGLPQAPACDSLGAEGSRFPASRQPEDTAFQVEKQRPWRPFLCFEPPQQPRERLCEGLPPLPFFSACKISFSWKKAASPCLPLRYLSLGNGRASAGWGRGEARSAPTAPSEAWKLSFVNAEIPPRILQWQIIVTRIIKLQRQGHLSWLFAKQSTFPPSSLALARLRGLSCLATYRQRSPCPHCCQSKPKLPRDVRGEKCTWACSILPGAVCQGNRKAITPA